MQVRAQGATEYLVLLAVVLIIALVGVALLGFFPGTAGDAQLQESRIYWSSASPIAVVEAPGAYMYTNDWKSQMAYLKIRNTGQYPIRLARMLGGSNKSISQYVNCGSIGCSANSTINSMSEIYLAPGEETCFGHRYIGGEDCYQHSFAFLQDNETGSYYGLPAASAICDTQGKGVLTVENFGFEYVQYVEGQQITKRQVGAKDLLIRCIGTVGPN